MKRPRTRGRPSPVLDAKPGHSGCGGMCTMRGTKQGAVPSEEQLMLLRARKVHLCRTMLGRTRNLIITIENEEKEDDDDDDDE